VVVDHQIDEVDRPAAIDIEGIGLFRENRWILSGINWRVGAGECAAILGPNGSGKSTLARIIGGHLWPTEGRCTILGATFGSASLPELRKRIRLLQPAGPYDVDAELTAREIVLTGFFASLSLYETPTLQQVTRAEELLKLVGLSQLSQQIYSRMSSGERVRSLLARALTGKPELLLLDEPTSGLDLLGREQLLATIQELATGTEAPAIVIITHHVEELPPAVTQVLLLEDGKIAASGKPQEVLRSQILSRVYRCPVEVKESGGRFYLQVHPQAWKELKQ
jgi:iron complex transport system ATP-binding protein